MENMHIKTINTNKKFWFHDYWFYCLDPNCLMINTKKFCYTSNPDCPKEINHVQEDGTTFGDNTHLYIIIAVLVLIIIASVIVFFLCCWWQRKKKITQPLGMSNPQFTGLNTIWFRYMYATFSTVLFKKS